MWEGKESDLLAACVGREGVGSACSMCGKGRSLICLQHVWEWKESDLLKTGVGREGV